MSSTSQFKTTSVCADDDDDDKSDERHDEDSVTARMRHLWRENMLCDVQLRVGERLFCAHRNMLASVSEYFRAMFTSGFSESTQAEVELNDISVNAMSVLLDHVYGVQIALDATNLQDVLHAASLLQFPRVQETCAKYMADKVDSTNCIMFLLLAERYTLTTCFDHIALCVLHNFVVVSQHADFLSLSVDMLANLLANDRLFTGSELQVFQAVCRWLKANQTTLGEKLHDISYRLFSLVRYELLMDYEMTKVYREPVMRSDTCWPVLQDALDYHLRLSSESPPPVPMRKICTSLRILCADDVMENPIENVLEIGIQDGAMHFTACIENAHSHVGAAVAVVNGFVYVVGGFISENGRPTAKMSRYNPRDRQWVELCPMSVPRKEFVLVSRPPDCLVAIGGNSTLTNRPLLTCEYYSISSNTWRKFPSLPYTLNSHSGCSHQFGDSRHAMYVSGGWNDGVTKTFMAYETGAWREKAPMLHPRYGHVIVPFENRLIVCAGSTTGGRDITTVELYDIRARQWADVQTTVRPIGQWGPSPIIHESKLYILGGWKHSGGRADTVQCYDLQRNDWRRINMRLPQALGNVVAYCT